MHRKSSSNNILLLKPLRVHSTVRCTSRWLLTHMISSLNHEIERENKIKAFDQKKFSRVFCSTYQILSLVRPQNRSHCVITMFKSSHVTYFLYKLCDSIQKPNKLRFIVLIRRSSNTNRTPFNKLYTIYKLNVSSYELMIKQIVQCAISHSKRDA